MNAPSLDELKHILGLAHAYLEDTAGLGSDNPNDAPTAWELEAVKKTQAWLTSLDCMSLIDKIGMATEVLAENGVNLVTSAWLPHMEKVLTISTSHLEMTTAKKLEEGVIPGLVVFEKSEYGWWVSTITTEDPDYPDYQHDVPEELLALIQYAGKLGCEWLCLDRDADVLDNMPTWEW